jgi:hypothetical protein
VRKTFILLLLGCQGLVSELKDAGPGADAQVGDAGAPDSGAADAGAADAGAPDASVPDAGAPDAGVPDSGVPDAGPDLVPIIVVSGWYGRMVSSCDDGRTWQAHDEPDASSGSGEFNEKGLAYAQGVFMQLIGWGAQCSFKRSEDGVNWEHLSLADVGLGPMTECGGIASTGDAFLMVHAWGDAYLSSDAGRAFSYVSMVNNGEYVRDVGGDGPPPGVIGAGGANDPLGMIETPPHFSLDRGLTWLPATGCPNFNAISVGQYGGVSYGNGRLVFVGYRGQVCVSSDLSTFEQSSVDAGGYNISGRATFAAGKFWVANGQFLWSSTDALSWSVQVLPQGMRITTVGGSDQGTLVGFDGDSSTFYRSTDGVTWLPAQGPGAGPPLGRIVFGYGKRSAQCP